MSSSPGTLTSLPPELLHLITFSVRVAGRFRRRDLKALSQTSQKFVRPAQKALLEDLQIDGTKIYHYIGTPFDFDDSRGRLGALEDRGLVKCIHSLHLDCIDEDAQYNIHEHEQDGDYDYQQPLRDSVRHAASITSIVDLISRLPGLRELTLEFPVVDLTEELIARLRPSLRNLTRLSLVSGSWDLEHTFLAAILQCTPNLTTLDIRMVARPQEGADFRQILTQSLLPNLRHLVLRSSYYLRLSRYSLLSLDLVQQIEHLSIEVEYGSIKGCLPWLTEEEAMLHSICTLSGSSLRHLTVAYSPSLADQTLSARGINFMNSSIQSLSPLVNLQTLTFSQREADLFILRHLPPSCTHIIFDYDFALSFHELSNFLVEQREMIGDKLRGRTLRLKSEQRRLDYWQLWRECEQLGLKVEFTPLAETWNGGYLVSLRSSSYESLSLITKH